MGDIVTRFDGSTRPPRARPVQQTARRSAQHASGDYPHPRVPASPLRRRLHPATRNLLVARFVRSLGQGALPGGLRPLPRPPRVVRRAHRGAAGRRGPRRRPPGPDGRGHQRPLRPPALPPRLPVGPGGGGGDAGGHRQPGGDLRRHPRRRLRPGAGGVGGPLRPRRGRLARRGGAPGEPGDGLQPQRRPGLLRDGHRGARRRGHPLAPAVAPRGQRLPGPLRPLGHRSASWSWRSSPAPRAAAATPGPRGRPARPSSGGGPPARRRTGRSACWC